MLTEPPPENTAQGAPNATTVQPATPCPVRQIRRAAHDSCCAGLELTNEQENNMRAGCRPGMQTDDTRIGTDVDRRAAA